MDYKAKWEELKAEVTAARDLVRHENWLPDSHKVVAEGAYNSIVEVMIEMEGE